MSKAILSSPTLVSSLREGVQGEIYGEVNLSFKAYYALETIPHYLFIIILLDLCSSSQYLLLLKR